jgi:hypothetical protein
MKEFVTARTSFASYTQDVGLAITWPIHCARNSGENGGDVEDLLDSGLCVD